MRKLFYAMSLALTMALVLTGCDKGGDDNQKFTVTFNSNGGSAVNSMKIEEGTKITRPTNPTNGALIFVDWYKEAALTNVWNFSSDVVTSNITLYAKWTTVEYAVSFNTNGGSAIAPVMVVEGGVFLAPLPPSKADFAFNGWYKEAALTNVWNFSSDVVTSNITLYAKWVAVSVDALQTLVIQANNLEYSNYTDESYTAMRRKFNAAQAILDNPEGVTPAQILAAYNDLQAAITALVPLEVRDPVEIGTDFSVLDGFVYVNPGEHQYFNAYALDAQGENATDKRVTFIYDPSELAAWADGDVEIDGNRLAFIAKSTLTAGKTLTIAIKSTAKPAVSLTVTLKVPTPGAMKNQFILGVNTLPAPEQISYEHEEAIERAYSFYYTLSNEERQEEAVMVAYNKLNSCHDALDNLPGVFDFSFSGDICTFTAVYSGRSQTKTTFVAKGAFPQGTYTTTMWEEGEKDGYYYQYRISLNANGQGTDQHREASNANGTGATGWEDNSSLTYTFTGSKDAGGRLTLTYIDEVYKPKSTHRIFKR